LILDTPITLGKGYGKFANRVLHLGDLSSILFVNMHHVAAYSGLYYFHGVRLAIQF
jgi:hypothetical protein